MTKSRRGRSRGQILPESAEVPRRSKQRGTCVCARVCVVSVHMCVSVWRVCVHVCTCVCRGCAILRNGLICLWCWQVPAASQTTGRRVAQGA